MSSNFKNNAHIDDLMIKFLDRQTSPEEEEELRTWSSQSKENKQYLVEIQYLWNTVALNDKTPFNGEAAFQRFKARIAVQQTAINNSRHFKFYPFLRWAGVFLLVFIMAGFGIYIFNKHLISNNKKQYSINVCEGAKVKINLPDKSVVWLNSGSTLRYNQDFGINNRQVSLVGEGYFEIARNPNKPFVVHIKQASIKVLGTKFNVNAYLSNEHVDVTLLKGSIQLKTIYQDNALILKPNQRAIIDIKNQTVSVVHIVASESVTWTKGKFFFKYKSLGNIVHTIEQCYNIKITDKNSQLPKFPFYDDFHISQSINSILNIIENNDEMHF